MYWFGVNFGLSGTLNIFLIKNHAKVNINYP